jgi:hypothetical protein
MSITIEKLINFNQLPVEIQTEIKTVDRLEYNRFHCVEDVTGYKDGKCIFGFAVQSRILAKGFEVLSYVSYVWEWSQFFDLKKSILMEG